MRDKRLDQKLDCKTCGTIYLDIPEGAKDGTPIHCSTCGGYLGTWGELQDDFAEQSDSGVFDLKRGQIIEK
ncbi:hypothetical protein [Aquamicrobium sp. LC103]|uniref:hypothetical protein n=1 Tax=Aquamicrobium sp. LC103 TaxID=1120658 RepID=UPI00063E9DF3|nr:hypothetical protein [Aquamicrobium sp. LC103]TKT79026.1 hypothetical protein XW59_008785 [Aquamicrobium sp. LC103]